MFDGLMTNATLIGKNRRRPYRFVELIMTKKIFTVGLICDVLGKLILDLREVFVVGKNCLYLETKERVKVSHTKQLKGER